MSDDTAITFAVEQNVGIVTLNLPQKLNALTTALYYRLGSLLREADIHPDTLVTMIIGTGRFFSAYFCPHIPISRTSTKVVQGCGSPSQRGNRS